jgi:arylsulfatase A-like enzyme
MKTHLTRREFVTRTAGLAAAPFLLSNHNAAAAEPGHWVVLVTIDTLRADHCHAYGYPRETTPFLDRLAQRGTRFAQCHSVTGTTYPSHTSILTGLQLPQHGVLGNRSAAFNAEGATMAAHFRAQGYTTAGFGSIKLLQNLSGDFDHFDSTPNGFYRWSEHTVQAVQNFLEKQPSDKPLFLWVHLFDPHEWMNPNEPQAALESMQADEAERERLYEHWTQKQRKAIKTEESSISGLRFGGRDFFIEKQLQYDSRIRYTDGWLEKLYESVESKAPGGALWMVTADHGEALGNHRYDQHARYLYDCIIHVPLVVALPGQKEGTVVQEVVSHTDLWPTLAAAMEWKAPKEHPHRHGLPIFGNAADLDALTRRRIFAQREIKHPDYQASRVWVDDFVYCTHDARYKYIVNGSGEDELYDLAQDPDELNNIAATSPEAAALREDALKMAALLRERAFAPADDTRRPEELTEQEETLRALGYV